MASATGPVSPGRARHRLLARLESECASHYQMSTLHAAVVGTYEVGERTVPGLVGDVLATIAKLRPAAAPGVYVAQDGRRLAVTCGRAIFRPGDYDVALGDLFAATDEQVLVKEALRSPGRYEVVTGVAPRGMEEVLIDVVHAATDMLETLQTWIEDKIFSVVEDATTRLSNGVYDVINTVSDRPAGQTHIDVAVIGQLAGWRVPNTTTLARTIGQLRNSKGKREADALAATFVSTTLPRHELLMSRALDAHQAIVVPFCEAPYVIAGTYFGIACQLLDGEQTQRIHPVYESPGLNVLLLYPASDTGCSARIERNAEKIERHIASNLTVYEVALRAIEGTLGPPSSSAKRNLMTILDEVTGRIELVRPQSDVRSQRNIDDSGRLELRRGDP